MIMCNIELSKNCSLCIVYKEILASEQVFSLSDATDLSGKRYRVIVMPLSGSGSWTLSATMHLTRVRMMEEDRLFVYALTFFVSITCNRC